MVDAYEDCDGSNKQCVPKKMLCDMGRNWCVGRHLIWVRHFIDPRQKPKCMRCRCFPVRNRPQLSGLTSSCFNVRNLNTSFWSMRP